MYKIFRINLKTLWCYETVLFASNRAFDAWSFILHFKEYHWFINKKLSTLKHFSYFNAFEEKYQFQLFFLNSFFFHLKLSHSQPNRKSLATDKNKKNSKYVWKFSWMLNHVELNAVLSETLVYAYFVLMGLD